MKDIVNKKTGEIIYEEREEHTHGLSAYNQLGQEVPDPRPVALPVGFKRPKTVQETIKDLLRNEDLKKALAVHELDTFEEADDFNTGEPDPMSGTPYEDCFEPDIPGLAAREQEIRAGAVLDRPMEKKRKASYMVDRYKRQKESKNGMEMENNSGKRYTSVDSRTSTGDRRRSSDSERRRSSSSRRKTESETLDD